MSSKNYYFALLLLFFIVVTVSMVTTSQISRVLIEQTRYIVIALLAFGLFLSVFLIKVSYQNIFSLIVILSFFALGYLLSLIFGGLVDSNSLFIIIIITFTGCYLFSSSNIKILQYKLAIWFMLYAIIILIITFASKGIVFTPVPTFVFEYTSNMYDSNATYSQGISQFFGYTALATASLIDYQSNKRKKTLLLLLVLLFLSLSLLGGARGDSVFALLITFSYFVFRLKIKDVFKIVFLSIILVALLSNVLDFSDLIIFKRLDALSTGFGSRDILLSQSFMLLSNEPGCIIHGCGFGFFQSYFNYDIGLYPHNFLVELIIVFGLPLTVLMLLACYKGVFAFFKIYGKVDIIALFFIYTIFLGLKSGSLATSWLLITFFLYFISFYISRKWSFSQL